MWRMRMLANFADSHHCISGQNPIDWIFWVLLIFSFAKNSLIMNSLVIQLKKKLLGIMQFSAF